MLTDGAEHARLRKQVQPGFSKGAMDSCQGSTEKLAAEVVADVLANPGCDVVQQLAIPMPIRMIAQILGVPECDIGDFRRWSENAVRIMDFSPTPRGVVESVKAVRALTDLGRYFLQQFGAGGLKGSGTVLGRLVEHNTDGSLTDHQLLIIAIHLLIAGNETTTNLLGGMFDTLARTPNSTNSSAPTPNSSRWPSRNNCGSPPRSRISTATPGPITASAGDHSHRIAGPVVVRRGQSRPGSVRRPRSVPRGSKPAHACGIRLRSTHVPWCSVSPDGSTGSAARTGHPCFSDIGPGGHDVVHQQLIARTDPSVYSS